MQEHKFCYSLRLLEIEGCDLILGGDWLRSCTPIELDYEKMTCTVTFMDQRIQLQALTTTVGCSLIADTQLFHMLHSEVEADIMDIYVVSVHSVLGEAEPALQVLLEQFHEVFEEPKEGSTSFKESRTPNHSETWKCSPTPVSL